MTKKKSIIMLVGPTPPLIGGISIQISNMLNCNLQNNKIVVFTTNKQLNTSNNTSMINTLKNKFTLTTFIKNYAEPSIILIYHFLLFPLILLRVKPKIIHINTPSYLGFLESSLYVLISKLFRKKVILHIHGGGFDLFYKDSPFYMKYYIRYIMKSANRIIALSNKWKKTFVNEIGINETSIDVVHNGYDSSLFYQTGKKESRICLDLPLNKKIILSAGDLIEIKGHKYLIEAISEITKSRTDIICVIIGKGKLKNKLLEQIELAEMSNYVKLVGEKKHNEIPLWMNAADIFVLPSLNEGNPTVMLEALGIGLPFIGTKVGAIPEIIVSNDYGLLTETKNSSQLAEKILYALEYKWDRHNIIDYAGRFKWDNICKHIHEVYQSLL